MRHGLWILAALAACGSENTIIGDESLPGLSIPPEIEDPIQQDRTVQVIEPVVDILFIVDNSSSMGNEQMALRNNFPRFIEHFVNAGIDYHIAMVSTDMQRMDHRGMLRVAGEYNYIDDETPEPVTVFQQMTNTLGVHIGSIESGRAAAYTALELLEVHPRNEGFLRDEADLHMIFVTDDNDYSGGDPVSKNEFIQWAQNFKGTDWTTTMHGIVTPPQPCNGNITSADYIDYAQETGGVLYSICAPDWGPALDQLGMAAAGLRQEFFLTRVPVRFPDLLLEVQVKTTDEDGNEIVLDFVECREDELETRDDCEAVYMAGRNSIVFLDFTPDALSEVIVTYPIAEDYSAE